MRLYTILLSPEDRDAAEYLRHVGKFKSLADAIRGCIRAYYVDAKKYHQNREGDI